MDVDFGLLLALAFRCYVGELHDRLTARGFEGVRSSFGPVLRALRSGEATSTELARDLGVSKQAIGRVVEEMRRLGLVVQRSDRSDRRVRRLSLTLRGREMVDTAIEFAGDFERSLQVELGPERAGALRQALEQMVERAGESQTLTAGRLRMI